VSETCGTPTDKENVAVLVDHSDDTISIDISGFVEGAEPVFGISNLRIEPVTFGSVAFSGKVRLLVDSKPVVYPIRRCHLYTFNYPVAHVNHITHLKFL